MSIISIPGMDNAPRARSARGVIPAEDPLLGAGGLTRSNIYNIDVEWSAAAKNNTAVVTLLQFQGKKTISDVSCKNRAKLSQLSN